MKVLIELDATYSGALSLTAVGSNGFTVFTSTQCVDLSKHNHLVLGSDGRWTNTYCPFCEINFDYTAEDDYEK